MIPEVFVRRAVWPRSGSHPSLGNLRRLQGGPLGGALSEMGLGLALVHSRPALRLGLHPPAALFFPLRLQSLRVPAYFTECSEYSCAVDEAAVSMATGGSASPAHMNPFRSPFRQAGIDNAMPWWVPSRALVDQADLSPQR